MKTLGLMRLHRFEHPDWVIPEIAQYVDGMVYTTHQLRNSLGLHCAEKHPKTLEIVPCYIKADNVHVLNGRLLNFGFNLLAKHKPEYILYFDEDEIPPGRFAQQFAMFKQSPAELMLFRFMFTYGDRDTLCKLGYHYGWHGKTLKWRPDITKSGYSGYCIPRCYALAAVYRCPFPLRHFPYTTGEMRKERENDSWKHRDIRFFAEAAKRGGVETIPYDVDMTFAEWRAWIGHPVKGSGAAGFYVNWRSSEELK